MRLVHVSDLHFGAINLGRPENLRAAILAAAPDVLVVSGDLTQRGSSAQFKQARAFLDSILLPQLVVPGNHDVPGGWRFADRFFRPWRRYRRIVSKDLEPVWQRQDLIIVGANSVRPSGWYVDWSRGHLSREQLARMEAECAKAPAEAMRVLVVHHPPAVPSEKTRRHLIGRHSLFMDSVKRAGIDLVMAGHFHFSYALPLLLPGADARHCVLSVTSTATSHRLKGEPNGFHVIEGDATALKVTAWTWGETTYGPRQEWSFRADGAARNWGITPAAAPP